MDNWKPGIRKTNKVYDHGNPTLRMMIGMANLLKIDASKLAKSINSKSSKEYAKKLADALDKEIKAGYEKAVKGLQDLV